MVNKLPKTNLIDSYLCYLIFSKIYAFRQKVYQRHTFILFALDKMPKKFQINSIFLLFGTTVRMNDMNIFISLIRHGACKYKSKCSKIHSCLFVYTKKEKKKKLILKDWTEIHIATLWRMTKKKCCPKVPIFITI